MRISVRLLRAVTALLIMMSLYSCADPATPHRLELKDESGNVAAIMIVAIPSPLPPSAQQFKGSWQLISNSSAFPTDSVEPGSYLGYIEDGIIRLDLNPRWADNNVVLEYSVNGEVLAGRWQLATVAGFRPGGSFRTLK